MSNFSEHSASTSLPSSPSLSSLSSPILLPPTGQSSITSAMHFMDLDAPAMPLRTPDIISSGHGRTISPAVLSSPLSIKECRMRISAQISEITNRLILAAPNTDESMLRSWRRERDLKLLDLKAVTDQLVTLERAGGSDTSKSQLVPRALPKIQWVGHAFDSTTVVYPDLASVLTYFEDVLRSSSLVINDHWFRLMPPLLAPVQRLWFSEFVLNNGSQAPWESFKAAMITRFGVSLSDDRSLCSSELLSVRMSHAEDIDAFHDRFTNLKRRSGITDTSVLRLKYVDALPSALYEKVVISLSSLPLAEKEDLNRVMSVARELYFQLYKVRTSRVHCPSSSLSSSSKDKKTKHKKSKRSRSPEPKRDTDKSKYARTKSSAGSKDVSKVYCAFHQTSTHDSKDCRALATSVSNNAPPVRRALTGECRKCLEPGWTPSHRCKTAFRSQSSNNEDSGNRAYRFMARTPENGKSADNSASAASPAWANYAPAAPTISSAAATSSSSVAAPATPSSSSSSAAAAASPSADQAMDLDEASYALMAQNCKYDSNFSKPPKHKSNSILIPVIIESHKCYAFLDTGSDFSIISPSFQRFLNTDVHVNPGGSIQLGHKNSCVPRLGTTTLNVFYNKIAITHTFEVFDFFTNENVPICFGLDIMSRLNIGITGLVTAFFETVGPKIPEPIDPDSIKPNDSPYGSKQEREALFNKIYSLLDVNAQIDMKHTYCNLPGAIIHLTTKPGAVAYKRQYPLPVAYKDAVLTQIKTWLDEGVIELAPSHTSYNSPLLVVKKKDLEGNYTLSKPRVVTDVRKLNEILVVSDRQQIPLISDIHQRIGQSSVHTLIDIHSCFTSFLVAPEDREKLSFTCPYTNQQYRYVKACFGITFVGNVVQRVLTNLFADLPYANVYIDDIVISTSPPLSHHVDCVAEVLRRLTKANLVVNPDKIVLAQQNIHILGWTVIANGGLIPDPRKLTNIHTWPIPTTGKMIQRYLGFANYFRNSIPLFADICGPLDALRNEKSLDGIWSNTHLKAFRNIQRALSSAPVLSPPDMSYGIHVATDASVTGIGGIMYQIVDDHIRYIGMASRKLSVSEQNYSTTKRELLAVVYMFKKFHKWLFGIPFTLHTDHKSLIYLHTQESPNALMLNWYDTIFSYSFNIVHLPGVKNIIPDALSRLFSDDNNLEGDDFTSNNDNRKKRKINTKDKQNKKILSSKPHQNALLHRALRYQDYMTPPVNERDDIIFKAHLLGHFGVNAVEDTIHNDKLHWTNLRQDIERILSQCVECNKHNISKIGYHPPKSVLPDGPLDHWCMDLGTFDVTSGSGNNYVLVLVDYFTRFTILRALPDKQSTTIAKELLSIFCLFGFPKIINSDNGTEFVNEIVSQMIIMSGIDRRLSAPYSPMGNSVNEAYVGITKRTIIKQLKGVKHDWDLYLNCTQYAINCKYARLHKSRPYAVLFNKQPNDFIDYTNVRSTINIEKADTKAIDEKLDYVNKVVIPALSLKIKETQERDHDYFMKKHRIIHSQFPINSEVYVKNIDKRSKTDPHYIGPLIVTNITKNGLYVLEWKNNRTLFSRDVPTSHIKLASSDNVLPSNSTPGDHYEVQAILDHRGTHGNYEYLVQWKGYNDPSENTWEPTANFDSLHHIDIYWGRRQKQHPNANKRNPLPKTVNSQKYTPRLPSASKSKNKRSKV